MRGAPGREPVMLGDRPAIPATVVDQAVPVEASLAGAGRASLPCVANSVSRQAFEHVGDMTLSLEMIRQDQELEESLRMAANFSLDGSSAQRSCLGVDKGSRQKPAKGIRGREGLDGWEAGEGWQAGKAGKRGAGAEEGAGHVGRLGGQRTGQGREAGRAWRARTEGQARRAGRSGPRGEMCGGSGASVSICSAHHAPSLADA